jgi:hypothetical protein
MEDCCKYILIAVTAVVLGYFAYSVFGKNPDEAVPPATPAQANTDADKKVTLKGKHYKNAKTGFKSSSLKSQGVFHN